MNPNTILKTFILFICAATAAVSHAKSVTATEAEESIATARVKCQGLVYDSSKCMDVVKKAEYVDAGLMDLCMERVYQRFNCLAGSINKFYKDDEIKVCKAKVYDFQKCIDSLGTTIKVTPDKEEDEDAFLEIRQIQLKISEARRLIEQGYTYAALKKLIELETKLESNK